jgi:hypothetical protein
MGLGEVTLLVGKLVFGTAAIGVKGVRAKYFLGAMVMGWC